MKLKDGFLLRQVAGQQVVLPSGGELDLDLMITLNGTAAFLWQRLQTETTQPALVAALQEEYEVDEPTAQRSVEAFVRKLAKNGFLA